MDHDVTHCMDYSEESCPEWCYRAQVTKALRTEEYRYPVSFSHLKGTELCPLSVGNQQDASAGCKVEDAGWVEFEPGKYNYDQFAANP